VRLQLPLIMRMFGLAILALMGLLMLVNALIMLFSPKAWFDLPPYISLRGSFRRERLSSFQGRLGIRLLGFVMTSVLISIMVNILRGPTSAGPSPPTEISRIVYEAVCLATCLAVGGCGLIMLFRPRWWVDKYILHQLTSSQSVEFDRSRAAIEVAIRILSLVVIGPAVYFAFKCVASL
jgi:hypothetical protein